MSHHLCSGIAATRSVLFIILISLTMASCTTEIDNNSKPEGYFIYLTDMKPVSLPGPKIISEEMDTFRQIVLEFKNKQTQFNLYIRSTGSELLIIAMTEMGQEVFELTYTDTDLNMKTRSMPDTVKPEYIVMDFMLSFADPDALKEILASAGLQLIENIKPDCTRRIIYDNKTAIIEVTIKEDMLKYDNLLRGYSYSLFQGGQQE